MRTILALLSIVLFGCAGTGLYDRDLTYTLSISVGEQDFVEDENSTFVDATVNGEPRRLYAVWYGYPPRTRIWSQEGEIYPPIHRKDWTPEKLASWYFQMQPVTGARYVENNSE